MNDASVNPHQPPSTSSRWQPLSAIDRRVVGVLAEKAKTTPDIYPMSLNAICTGCNQKSNRDPLMQLEPDDVQESLDRLRGFGAVGLVEGYGRVAKYRHYLYEWLGVEKAELAVMTELLLRGDQTVGELRTRAARMEPIPDLNALHPILDSLKGKGLVVSLTPEGRGHVVTHALYKPREIETLRAKYSGARPSESIDHHPSSAATVGSPSLPASSHDARSPHMPSSAANPTSVAAAASRPHDIAGVESLRRDLDQVRTQVVQLQNALDEAVAEQHRLGDELRALKDALGA